MHPEEQRKRNTKRLSKLFGPCRIMWTEGRANVIHVKDPLLNPYVICVEQRRNQWRVVCMKLDFHWTGQPLSAGIQLLKTHALLNS